VRRAGGRDVPCEFFRCDVKKLQAALGWEVVETVHDAPTLSLVVLEGREGGREGGREERRKGEREDE